MAWLYFSVLGPVVAGVVLAVVGWLIRGRAAALPRGAAAAFSLAAALLLILAAVAVRLMGTSILWPFDLPGGFWDFHRDHRFAVPLLLGILGLALLALPARSRRGRGTAGLAPRTPASFARRRWFAVPAVVLALILTATLIAGTASQPDPTTGRHTMYFVELGGGRIMGTSIYGWYSSVPCLILIGLLIAFAIVDLSLVSRPALGHPQEPDVRIRTVRTRNILALGTGALLLHFGLVLGSLAGTASVRGGVSTSEGLVTIWTTFAALAPALSGASTIAAVLGFALWTTVALSAIPARRRSAVTLAS